MLPTCLLIYAFTFMGIARRHHILSVQPIAQQQACNRQTDEQTDRHRTSFYNAPSTEVGA